MRSREDETFQIEDLKINPFTIPHDAAQPVWLTVWNVMTTVLWGLRQTLGNIMSILIEHLQNLDALASGGKP